MEIARTRSVRAGNGVVIIIIIIAATDVFVVVVATSVSREYPRNDIRLIGAQAMERHTIDARRARRPRRRRTHSPRINYGGTRLHRLGSWYK